ncbi:MAG: SAM-dependent methyltransferase [Salibacteraceae bacterium]
MKPGRLLLIPTGLSDSGVLQYLPPQTLERLHQITYFIAERAKSARSYLKATGHPVSMADIHLSELDKHQKSDFEKLLEPCLLGHDCGLMSEAGMPGIADPGARVVSTAHRLGIEVEPLVGPSSIFLALMASGMNGQQFAFHGYLPRHERELAKKLQQLENESGRYNQTQLFIETPYRNQKLLQVALNTLRPDTLFCIAAGLHHPSQFIKTQPVEIWKATPPTIHKVPAVFAIFSGEMSGLT